MDNKTNDVSKKKPATTFEKQIEILKSRNLIINNEEKALNILKRVNYYRLSAYMLSLKENDKFYDGVTFQQIYNIYNFDKRFRNLIMKALENIEIAFKTHIAYVMGNKYGTLCYTNFENFNQDCKSYYDKFIINVNDEINKREKDELFIKHYEEKYNSQYPIWVIVETLTFGCISKMYSILKKEDQKTISEEYYKLKSKYIINWLYSLSHVRNICAHYGRLYNKTFPIHILLYKNYKEMHIQNNRIFAALLIINRLSLNRNEWYSIVIELSALIERYQNDIDLDLMGFPKDWEKLLFESPFLHTQRGKIDNNTPNVN